MANEVNKNIRSTQKKTNSFCGKMLRRFLHSDINFRHRAEAPIIWGMTERRGRTETEKHGSPVVWHMYSLWCMLGHDGSEQLVDAALRGLTGELHDDINGGWYAGLTKDGEIVPSKQCLHMHLYFGSIQCHAGKRPGQSSFWRKHLCFMISGSGMKRKDCRWTPEYGVYEA